jgi:hypothetical protein
MRMFMGGHNSSANLLPTSYLHFPLCTLEHSQKALEHGEWAEMTQYKSGICPCAGRFGNPPPPSPSRKGYKQETLQPYSMYSPRLARWQVRVRLTSTILVEEGRVESRSSWSSKTAGAGKVFSKY